MTHPNSLANLKKGHDWSKRKKTVKVNALSFALMLQYLIENPNVGYAELAEHSGLHYMTVGHWIREWHKLGLIHISGWDKDAWGRAQNRLFTFGPGKDAKRPKMTMAERARAHRARKKQRALQEVWKPQPVAQDA